MLEDACSIALLNCCGLDAIPDLSCAADDLTCLRSLRAKGPATAASATSTTTVGSSAAALQGASLKSFQPFILCKMAG